MDKIYAQLSKLGDVLGIIPIAHSDGLAAW